MNFFVLVFRSHR